MNILALDAGGTYIKYAVMDQDANILEKGEVPTPSQGQEAFLDVIVQLYEQYEQQVEGIALSLPGNIDSDTGFIYASGALVYNAQTNIIDRIRERIDVPIAVENDGKSAALAEIWKGNLSDCDSGVVLIIGTGIGGGIVMDRKLIKGKNFFAGEISYTMSDLSATSFMDVLAAKASTYAFVLRTAQLKGIPLEVLDGKKAFAMMEQQDEAALQAFDEMTTYISGAIYNLQCLLDMDRVLLGGGISKQPKLLKAVQQKLDVLYQNIPFPIPRAQVMTCAYYNDSNLIGALYNYKLQNTEVEE